MRRRTAPVGARRSEEGFTLIEIAVGIAILAIGLMTLGHSMMTAARVEQAANEKRTALTWATGQLERVRGMSFGEIATVISAADPEALQLPMGWPTSASVVGSIRDLDADGDVDFFERHYYPPPRAPYVNGGITVPLEDVGLSGLRPQDGMSLCGTVSVMEPVAAQNGVGEDSGYWVTVHVRWKGVAGPSQMKLTTFVGR